MLIVEDSPMERQLVRALLANITRKEATIDEAANAEQAIDLLRKNTYDVVVADYHLGDGLNGVEVLIMARKLQPATRRLLLTGDARPQVAEEALQGGAAERVLLKQGRNFTVFQGLGRGSAG